MQITGWGVMALGMGIVFLGLISLIFISKLMSVACSLSGDKAKKAKQELKAAPAPAKAPAVNAAAPNRQQFTAAVAASIASYMGSEPAGLRIHSIQPVSQAPDKHEFVAAVSAAVAAKVGGDASSFVIHSIRQV